MDYRNCLDMTEATRQQHKTAVKDLAKILKDFDRHGWHDEDLAQDYYDREEALYRSLNTLHARLPRLATE